MVTVFLRGGLGNQMFQYAAGLRLAKKNDTQLFLDTVYLSDRFPRRNFAYRTFDLDIFALEPRFTLLSRVARSLPVPGAWLGLDLALMKAMGVFGIKKIVQEKSDDFDPAVLAAAGDVVLFGRWQRERYFADIQNDIRASFTFRALLTGEAAALAEKIRATNSVSLHVRRGDFAAFKNVIRLMGETDLSYYERASAYIAERVPGAHFFIFSDDIEWCKANLHIRFPATYVPASSEGPKASYHLQLMSLCKHNIIANSTFSWWGAWLNSNPQKIVVAPKQWYADGRGGDEDIIPERWIKL